MLAFGELIIGVTEFIGIGDLFTIGVTELPIDEVDALLNAGLAAGGVLYDVPTRLINAGVVIVTLLDSDRAYTGLKLQL